jgi:hypothetical protein
MLAPLQYLAALVLLCGMALPAPAHSQEPRQRPYLQVCTPVSLPFSPTPASQVRVPEMRSLLSGKRVVMVRPIQVFIDGSPRSHIAVQRFGRPTHRQFTLDLRDDGSVRFQCDVMDGLGSATRPCPNVAVVHGAEGPNEVGTWVLRDTTVCFKFSRYVRGSEICGAIHRHAEKYWFHQTQGAAGSCFQGDLQLQ